MNSIATRSKTVVYDETSPLYQTLDSYFSKTHKNFPFRRSGLGSSGFTFLPLSPFFNWVIKWQNPYQTESEYLCTQFYRRSFDHLSVPDVRMIVDKDLINTMYEFFQRYKGEDGTQVLYYYTPLVMEYKDGNNLFYAYKESHLFKLNAAGLEKLFHSFGEILGYDFVIANCDRFSPKGFRGAIDKRYRINSGNIMIEFVVPRELDPEETVAVLRTVHSIDNAPLFLFFFDTREKKYVEEGVKALEENLDGAFSLFGESPIEEQENSPSESDEDKEIEGPNLREERHQDFRSFVEGDDEFIHQLAMQSRIGIINELTTPSKESKESTKDFLARAEHLKVFMEKSENERAIREGMITGIKKARKHLKDPKVFEVVKELKEEEGCVHPNSAILLDFISRNISYVQKL